MGANLSSLPILVQEASNDMGFPKSFLVQKNLSLYFFWRMKVVLFDVVGRFLQYFSILGKGINWVLIISSLQ